MTNMTQKALYDHQHMDMVNTAMSEIKYCDQLTSEGYGDHAVLKNVLTRFTESEPRSRIAATIEEVTWIKIQERQYKDIVYDLMTPFYPGTEDQVVRQGRIWALYQYLNQYSQVDRDVPDTIES